MKAVYEKQDPTYRATGASVRIFFASMAFADPMRCDVLLSSRQGGKLEINSYSIPPGFIPGYHLVSENKWTPPASNRAINLVVSWDREYWEPPGPLVHGSIGFKPPAGVPRTSLSVTFTTGDGHQWRAPNYAIDYGMRDRHDRLIKNIASVNFSKYQPEGPEIMAEMENAGKIKITVESNQHEYISTIFDVSNIAARDALLEKARTRIKVSDPRVCTDAPLPVVPLFPAPPKARRPHA